MFSPYRVLFFLGKKKKMRNSSWCIWVCHLDELGCCFFLTSWAPFFLFGHLRVLDAWKLHFLRQLCEPILYCCETICVSMCAWRLVFTLQQQAGELVVSSSSMFFFCVGSVSSFASLIFFFCVRARDVFPSPGANENNKKASALCFFPPPPVTERRVGGEGAGALRPSGRFLAECLPKGFYLYRTNKKSFVQKKRKKKVKFIDSFF